MENDSFKSFRATFKNDKDLNKLNKHIVKYLSMTSITITFESQRIALIPTSLLRENTH